MRAKSTEQTNKFKADGQFVEYSNYYSSNIPIKPTKALMQVTIMLVCSQSAERWGMYEFRSQIVVRRISGVGTELNLTRKMYTATNTFRVPLPGHPAWGIVGRERHGCVIAVERKKKVFSRFSIYHITSS